MGLHEALLAELPSPKYPRGGDDDREGFTLMKRVTADTGEPIDCRVVKNL